MELTLEEIEPCSIAQDFEDSVLDDSMVINVKINFDVTEEAPIEEVLQELPFVDVKRYIEDLGCKILFSSAGYHLKGERKQPHLHYNFITSSFKVPSNPSQHRQRWFNKTDLGNPGFLKCSFKFHLAIDKKSPKYSVLSYPLKEGHIIKDNRIYVFDGKPMTKAQKTFLVETGRAIYEKEVGLKLRQDKCEERKKVALNDLHKLCSDNRDQFGDFREMVKWLDNNYIAKLTIEEYPDPKNYKVNCQKIAVNLGKLKYSDIL